MGKHRSRRHQAPSNGIRQVLSATIEAYAANLGRVLPVAAALAALSCGYIALTGSESAIPPAGLLWLVVAVPLWQMTIALIIRFVGADLRDTPEPLRAAIGASARRIVPLIGWSLVMGAAMTAVVIIVFIPIAVVGVVLAVVLGVAASAADAAQADEVYALGLFVAVAIWVAAAIVAALVLARWSLAPAAIVLDRMGPLAGSRRSSELTHRHRRRVAVLLLLMAAVFGIGSVATYAPLAVPELRGVGVVACVAILALTIPVLPIAFAVLYVRLDGSAVAQPAVSVGRRRLVIGTLAASLAVGVVTAGLTGPVVIERIAAASPSSPARGDVLFGTAREDCAVKGVSTRFTVGQEVHSAAKLHRWLAAGEEVALRASIGGVQLPEVQETYPSPVTCIFDGFATDQLPPGHYRMEYVAGSEVLATGEFDLVAP